MTVIFRMSTWGVRSLHVGWKNYQRRRHLLIYFFGKCLVPHRLTPPGGEFFLLPLILSGLRREKEERKNNDVRHKTKLSLFVMISWSVYRTFESFHARGCWEGLHLVGSVHALSPLEGGGGGGGGEVRENSREKTGHDDDDLVAYFGFS